MTLAASIVLAACAHAESPPVQTARGPARQEPVAASPAERVEAIRTLDLSSDDAVPTLIAALSDRDWAQGHSTPGWHPVGIFAADALVFVGEPAVPALIDALSDPDVQVRALAARAACRLAEGLHRGAGDALLLRASFDPAPAVRLAFLRWTSLREEVVARTLELVSDPDPSVRALAASRAAQLSLNPNLSAAQREALADAASPSADSSGPGCARASALARCRLTASDPQVRGDAVLALRGPDRVARLVDRLGDPFAHTRSGDDWSESRPVGERAAIALADVGPSAVPALLQTLADGDSRPSVRRDAAMALGLLLAGADETGLGPMWEPAVAALVAVTSSDEESLARVAIAEPVHATSMVERQIASLRSEHEAVRITAWRVLERQRADPRWSLSQRARIAAALAR